MKSEVCSYSEYLKNWQGMYGDAESVGLVWLIDGQEHPVTYYRMAETEFETAQQEWQGLLQFQNETEELLGVEFTEEVGKQVERLFGKATPLEARLLP